MLQLDATQFNSLVGVGPFPLLEKLSIALPFLDYELDEGFSAKVFADAPKLAQLHLGENVAPSMFPSPRISLSQSTCEKLSGDDFFWFSGQGSVLKRFHMLARARQRPALPGWHNTQLPPKFNPYHAQFHPFPSPHSTTRAENPPHRQC